MESSNNRVRYCCKPIPRIAPLSTADQRTLLDKIAKIARRGGKAGPGDRPVIPGAQPAIEAIRPFAEQALLKAADDDTALDAAAE